MDLQIGSTIGDYQILGVLGTGGMGSVYQVRNLLSDRVEALKVLLPDLTADPSLAERFQREIKVLASLDHPNIAQFRAAFRSGNQILMVMEFVDGVTLDRKLHDGPLSVPLALDVTGQVLAALEYAHARGIVHRDIKPANIFLTKAGVAKLMDFGIAKAATDHKLTSTGTAVGSLYYMSPEQIQGAATLDGRSDLYSVGVTLYQLVTGKRPFDGTSQFAIMSAHLEKPPVPPVALEPNLPSALNDLILMSVAKDPNSRFQTAAAFRGALAAVGASLMAPTEAVPAPPPTAPAFAPPPPPVRAPFATGNPPVMPPPMPPPAAPPPPAMAATAPSPAPFHPQGMAARPKSHRGLWMAIGGIAVAAAIVCLIEFGPWKGAKAVAAVPAQPPITAPVTQAETQPTPAPTPAQDAAAHRPRPRRPRPDIRHQRQTRARPPQAKAAQPQSRPPEEQPPAPPPQAAAAATAARSQQPRPEPAPASQATRPPGVNEGPRVRGQAALSLRRHQQSSATLQRRQQANGMSLNARFTRPQGLMNTNLEAADQALSQGDIQVSREFSEKAERQIEALEKLLNM